MEWHIVTGSRGGVGKTLLSLLLLANNTAAPKKQRGSTLILDLNGMNTDSAALLLYRQQFQREYPLNIETTEPYFRRAEHSLRFQTVSTGEGEEACQYAVGWTQDPFSLMNPRLFADLLCTLTTRVSDIEQGLRLSAPLRTVIIDSNYHFCNLFAQGSESPVYAAYRDSGKLGQEQINIWFLWVYRQLEKLLSNTTEAAIIRETAGTLENVPIKGSYCPGSSPFLHVFSPVMTSPAPDEGLLNRWLRSAGNRGDYVVPEFQALENPEQFPEQAGLSFDAWLQALHATYIIPRIADRNLEPAELFPEVIRTALATLGHRPKNIIPISVYQSSLRSYTDKQRVDPVSRLRKLKIYHNLSTLLR